jgi:transcriptional regulator with XRE-family HTH domain
MRQRIRAKRKELGMSQAELGRRVDVSRVAVCEYEAGRGSLSDQTLERMLDALDIDRVERAQRNLERHAAGTAQAIDDLRNFAVSQ